MLCCVLTDVPNISTVFHTPSSEYQVGQLYLWRTVQYLVLQMHRHCSRGSTVRSAEPVKIARFPDYSQTRSIPRPQTPFPVTTQGSALR